jgi:hypothetical protein
LLTARRGDRLKGPAQQLTAAHGVAVGISPADLAEAAALKEIFAFCAARNLWDANEVAARAVAGLIAGRRWIKPSWRAWLVANAPRFLPRATVSGATEHFYRAVDGRDP